MGKVVSFIWILTPISSTISVIIVWIALATSDWIRTQERILNSRYNGSYESKYQLKMTHSGILEMCAATVTDGDTDIICESIEYFPSVPYYPDPTDSSTAIPYAVRQSVFFFIMATLLQFFGEIGYLYGHYIRDRKVFVFIGGTIFIVTGLVMLIGIVMYISIFKTEVGSKVKPNLSSHHSNFNYQYGVSFMLYVSGFVCTELSGSCAVLLFVYQDQSVQSVHFIQPSPVVFRNYTTTANPALIYPCQVHQPVRVTDDMIAHHNMERVYTPRTPRRVPMEYNHACYHDSQHSPPYAPASELANYDLRYNYQSCHEESNPGVQSVTTQTVSTIYNGRYLNDDDETSSEYPDDFVPFNLERMTPARSSETFRKSTLV